MENIFGKMMRRIKPKHKIFLQKIDQEYIILITPYQNQEGLTSLITDKVKLTNYVRNKELRPKIITHECELKFKLKE